MATTARPTDRTEDPDALCAAYVETIARIAPDARAIGVSVGGPLDTYAGVVTGAPHLPHLIGFSLKARLEARSGLPVVVHHDAAACALAEYRWGARAGVRGLAYLTCGTGFGAGLVLDGAVRYGTSGNSPEIGHIRFRADGPDIFGKPGCFEGYASANALALLARWYDPVRYASSTPRAIVADAASGIAAARSAFTDHVEAVGAACALLADLLVVDTIVLGSLAVYLGDPWIDAVRMVFRREALPAHAERCELRAPMDGVQDRSALAAACDALAMTSGEK